MIDYFILTVCSGTALFLILLSISFLRPSRTVFLWLTVLIGYAVSNLLFFVWDWAWVNLTGSSIGKLVYGLRVVQVNGTKGIPGRVAARRSHALLWSLWYLFGFPCLTFLHVPGVEKRFLRTGTTTWDTKAGTVVIGKNINILRTVLAVTLTVASFLGILLWCAASASSHPYPQ